MIRFDPVQVEAARQGSRAALEALVNAAKGPVFNLAMRMLAHREDAEDATQEILIKIITHLGEVRDTDLAGAWAFRVATRHLSHTARLGRVERMRLSFEDFAEDLNRGQRGPSHLELTEVEHQLALKEVKVGCTLAMLVCLSRPLRMAYILGDIFEMTDTEASEILEIPAGTYRQRVRRARLTVSGFLQSNCSLQSRSAPCRCENRITPALQMGRIAKGAAQLDSDQAGQKSPLEIGQDVATLEAAQRSVAIMRSNPQFASTVPSLVHQVLAQMS
ncbi:RNA polymerase sigma factor [uncultured Roseovarius sp.]|uniref:RNA polymerase sigma factor n=1 Tax=uncultured Roseovarius sp. TaxID=293344 RepID=UPI000C8BA02F|nr:RNA polymerase [Roseovarius sp.]|tara:strand:+ start:3453 stop:4277 length:825 start_codon:yes stop_codon:yes gene_type:complete